MSCGQVIISCSQSWIRLVAINLLKMAKIESNKFSLTDLYADGGTNSKKTDVYSNGKMQACVFVAATYDDEISPEDLAEYVRSNVKIYLQSAYVEKALLDWEYSSISNEYQHDIYQHFSRVSDVAIRVPYFFTVPTSASGTYNLIAGHNENFVSPLNPVQVVCHVFSVSSMNFDFSRIDKDGKVLSLRYVGPNIPPNVKLVKMSHYYHVKKETTDLGKYTSAYAYQSSGSPCQIVHLNDEENDEDSDDEDKNDDENNDDENDEEMMVL